MSVTKERQKGFTLPEVMMALSIGSMLMLSSAQLYPLLRQRSQSLSRHFQLDQLLRSTVFNIEKDLQRAGFCNGQCAGSALQLGRSDGEAANSCVITTYDLNRNGRWEPPGSSESEYFGYRLRNGGIETQRGIAGCSGNGWEKLLDPAEVKVTEFKITTVPAPNRRPLFAIRIVAHWSDAPAIHRQVDSKIAGNAE